MKKTSKLGQVVGPIFLAIAILIQCLNIAHYPPVAFLTGGLLGMSLVFNLASLWELKKGGCWQERGK